MISFNKIALNRVKTSTSYEARTDLTAKMIADEMGMFYDDETGAMSYDEDFQTGFVITIPKAGQIRFNHILNGIINDNTSNYLTQNISTSYPHYIYWVRNKNGILFFTKDTNTSLSNAGNAFIAFKSKNMLADDNYIIYVSGVASTGSSETYNRIFSKYGNESTSKNRSKNSSPYNLVLLTPIVHLQGVSEDGWYNERWGYHNNNSVGKYEMIFQGKTYLVICLVGAASIVMEIDEEIQE